MTDAERVQKIDTLMCIKDQIADLDKTKKTIEAELTADAQTALENTKYKTIKFAGTCCKLVVTETDSVKITYDSLLPLIFGEAYGSMVKETTKYELTAPAKRLIAGLWKNEYITNSTVSDVIDTLQLDDKQKKLISKKCKGINYDKDISNLMTIAGLSEQQAHETAYLIAEANIWQQFMLLMEANGGTKTDTKTVLDKIQACFVVEQTTKITLEG